MFRVITYSLLIYISISSINGQTPGTFEDFFRSGAARLQAGELDAALDDVNRAIELNPNKVEAYMLRFMIRKKNPEDDDLADCNKIIELAPSAPGTDIFYLARANVRLRQLDWNNAFNDLNQAVSINPQNARNYNIRAYSYLLKGDLDRARADYEKSLELDSTQPSPFVRRGYLRWQNRDFEGALADFNKAIEWKPDYAVAYAYRGIVHGLRGNIDQAIRDIRRAMALDSQSISDNIPHHGFGSLSALNQFLKNHSTNAHAYTVRGIFRFLQRRDEEGISDFNKSVELDPALKSEIARITAALRSR